MICLFWDLNVEEDTALAFESVDLSALVGSKNETEPRSRGFFFLVNLLDRGIEVLLTVLDWHTVNLDCPSAGLDPEGEKLKARSLTQHLSFVSRGVVSIEPEISIRSSEGSYLQDKNSPPRHYVARVYIHTIYKLCAGQLHPLRNGATT